MGGLQAGSIIIKTFLSTAGLNEAYKLIFIESGEIK